MEYLAGGAGVMQQLSAAGGTGQDILFGGSGDDVLITDDDSGEQGLDSHLSATKKKKDGSQHDGTQTNRRARRHAHVTALVDASGVATAAPPLDRNNNAQLLTLRCGDETLTGTTIAHNAAIVVSLTTTCPLAVPQA